MCIRDRYKVSETPIVLSKPKVQYVPTQCTDQTTDKISKQEEKQLQELINEYEDVFKEAPMQTTCLLYTSRCV